jgi:hypothetical protein
MGDEHQASFSMIEFLLNIVYKKSSLRLTSRLFERAIAFIEL